MTSSSAHKTLPSSTAKQQPKPVAKQIGSFNIRDLIRNINYKPNFYLLILAKMTFAERRAARQEKRQERRANRQGGGGCDDASVSSRSSCGSKSTKSSHSSHSSKSSKNSRSSCCTKRGGPETYAMREKLMAFGNDFTIEKMDEGKCRGKGEPAYYVDNKIVRVRETFNIKTSRSGKVLYQVQERKLRVRDCMAIEDENGRKVAEIKKRVVGVVRDNFVIKVKGDTNWQCHGSILEHDFTIKENGKLVAKVHKKWITPIKDRYFIDVVDSKDAALVLMVAIGLEEMS